MSTAFDFASTTSVPRPPNRPVFIEPYHFYSKCTPDHILQHLGEICMQMRIDVTPGANLFSMECSVYVNYAVSDFWLSVFAEDKSVGSEELYLIEIQRRSGDSHAFQEAVIGIRSSLSERKVIEKESPVKRGWGDKAKVAIAVRTKSCGPDALARLQDMQSPDTDGCVFRSLTSHDSVTVPASAYSSFPNVENDDMVFVNVNHAVALASSDYEESLAGMAATHEQSQRAILTDNTVDILIGCLRSFTADVPDAYSRVGQCTCTLVSGGA